MIVALAGRRVDAPDAEVARFPLGNAPAVRERVRALLRAHSATALVCAAACGADLLALDAAGELGLRRRVVLPLARRQFRASSVTDRPGDWGPLFDAICDEAAARGDLVELSAGAEVGDDHADYEAGNRAILDEALALARPAPGRVESGAVLAVVVWEGQARGGGDLTADFRDEAVARGMVVDEVLTRLCRGTPGEEADGETADAR